MMNSKVNGWVYEEEAVDIIKYMYNGEDSEALISKLSKHYSYIKARSSQSEAYLLLLNKQIMIFTLICLSNAQLLEQKTRISQENSFSHFSSKKRKQRSNISSSKR